MSTKLSKKLERINTSVSKIRQKANMPDAVIEDLVVAVESMVTPEGSITITENSTVDVSNYAEAIVNVAGGGTIKSNIYKVTTIEERDALEPEENDICLVHTSEEFHFEGTTPTSDTLFFPATIVVSTPITASASMTLRCGPNTSTDRIACQLSATYFRIRDYVTYEYIANYTSADGVTYTRTSTYDSYTFNGDITRYTSFNTTFIPFLIMRNTDFPGLFQYSGGAWSYLDIGINNDLNEIFTTQTVYDSTGKHEGTFSRNQYDARYLIVSETEPENKLPIWFKPTTMPSATSYTVQQMNFTREEMEDFVQPTTVLNSNLSVPNDAGFTIYKNAIVVGDKAYIAADACMLIYDFINNTMVKKTLNSAGTTTLQTYTLANVGDYIYGVGKSRAFRYTISTDSLTYITTPTKGYIRDAFTYNNKAYFLDWQNDANSSGTHVTGNFYIFEAGATTYTTKYLPQGLKVWYASSMATDPSSPIMFVEDGYAYILSKTFYNYPDTTLKNQWVLAKLNIETMTIADSVSVDLDVDEEAYRAFNGWVYPQYTNAPRTAELVTVPKIMSTIHEDERYTYNVAETYYGLIRVDKQVVKDAIAQKDIMMLIYKKYASSILELNNTGMFRDGATLYYKGEYYACIKDGNHYAVIKKQKNLYHNNPISKDGDYIIIDTSDMKHAVNLYENEYIHFNDIYYVKANGSTSNVQDIVIPGDIYIYDNNANRYYKVN